MHTWLPQATGIGSRATVPAAVVEIEIYYCKTAQTCPSRRIYRKAADDNTPGLVAPRAFCKFTDWGMSELFCNTPLLAVQPGAAVKMRIVLICL